MCIIAPQMCIRIIVEEVWEEICEALAHRFRDEMLCGDV
jgi:hypothetical protein